ncbi:hypothetical protein HF313_05850 [Massilia atriviolacea]|nr:hypothetical protein [Massilia atriviolacea]
MTRLEFTSRADECVNRPQMLLVKEHNAPQTGPLEAWLWRRWQSCSK